MITKSLWMLYGATGYTGKLTVEEAVKRGHKPLLAGRSEAKLKPLAEQYGLEYVAFALDDRAALDAALERVELVLHDAGPYTLTAKAMLDACLATGTHYLDISGEFDVMDYTLSLSERAAEKGILLMNGVGFDVVPSDCLAAHVASQIDEPTTIELGILTSGEGSGGTLKTMLEAVPNGGWYRRNGELVSEPYAAVVKPIRFADQERMAMSSPGGELYTFYQSTGIPNMRLLRVMPPGLIRFMQRRSRLVQAPLRITPLRRLLQWMVGWLVDGPDEEMRRTAHSGFYVRVENERGESAEGWVQIPESYAYTAVVSVRVIEQVLDGDYKGTLTPAQAFGPDFILDIPGTTRYDSLPDQ